MIIAYPTTRKIDAYFVFENIVKEDVLKVGTQSLVENFMLSIGISTHNYFLDDKFGCESDKSIIKKWGEKYATFVRVTYTKKHGYKFVLS